MKEVAAPILMIKKRPTISGLSNGAKVRNNLVFTACVLIFKITFYVMKMEKKALELCQDKDGKGLKHFIEKLRQDEVSYRSC